ncbi:MAG TPA: hypothetical protein VG538_06175 [Vicinamibacterales bacterium]|nr:hypothetical protein [Vicinamibacterales bacterium]
MCEEFHCLPSEAFREWLTLPAGLLEDILEAKSYAHAKAIVDAKDAPKSQRYETPMTQMVEQIEMAIVAEELRNHG